VVHKILDFKLPCGEPALMYLSSQKLEFILHYSLIWPTLILGPRGHVTSVLLLVPQINRPRSGNLIPMWNNTESCPPFE